MLKLNICIFTSPSISSIHLLSRKAERRQENKHYEDLLGFRPDFLGEPFLTRGLYHVIRNGFLITLEYTLLMILSVNHYDCGTYSLNFPLENSLTFVDTYFGKITKSLALGDWLKPISMFCIL